MGFPCYFDSSSARFNNLRASKSVTIIGLCSFNGNGLININRFTYSFKKSKKYNQRCNRNRKINNNFCGLHNRLKLQVKAKKKCFAITQKGLKCKRVVKKKYCFQHLKNFKEV